MRIHQHGHGSPVVLLHGSPTSPSYFDPLVEALSPHRQVLVAVSPGYDGTPPLRPHSTQKLQEALEDALTALGATDVAVVGFSLGAYRALQLALTSQRIRVNRVFTLGAFTCLTPEHRQGMLALAQQASALTDFRDPAFRQMVASLMVAPAFATAHPEETAAIAAWLDAIAPADLAAEFRSSCAAQDLTPLVSGLRVPLTVRVGEQDAATPPAYSEQLAARVPAAVLQKVPGCGHALLIEDRKATVAAICEALLS